MSQLTSECRFKSYKVCVGFQEKSINSFVFSGEVVVVDVVDASTRSRRTQARTRRRWEDFALGNLGPLLEAHLGCHDDLGMEQDDL